MDTTTQLRGPLYPCSLLSPTPASVPVHSTGPTFLQSCQKFFTKISLEVYSWSSILAKNPATCKGARHRSASYTCCTKQTTTFIMPVITCRQSAYVPHTCIHRHARTHAHTPAHPSPLQQPALVAWADRYSRTGHPWAAAGRVGGRLGPAGAAPTADQYWLADT